MIWGRWAGVMDAPMKWEIGRIFVVGTGGSGFCAEAAPSGVIGFFMAVAPYSSFGILLLIVSVFDARAASAGRRRRHQPSVGLPVRAMVRRDDERAASLRAAGAQVVVGDLLEPGDVY